jgi:putative addiction module killer protein
MREVLETHEFSRWFEGLRDIKAQAIIQTRIDRLVLEGNPGHVEPVGEGVSEMKIDFGPGYRVYFVEHDDVLVVLLAGGDKASQARDIKSALALNRELRKES